MYFLCLVYFSAFRILNVSKLMSLFIDSLKKEKKKKGKKEEKEKN